MTTLSFDSKSSSSDVTEENFLKATFRAPAFPGSYFISMEGIEGAGKSTQIKLLAEYLERRKWNVIQVREPGGTPFGEKLRQAVLQSQTQLHPLSEAMLFASSRAQMMSDIVLKELSRPGTVIICDRFIDSSLVYQGFAGELSIPTILKLHQFFPLNIIPHLTFYFKIDVETSLKRQKMRNAPKDYFESKGSDFYKKLIEGYDEVAGMFPERIATINASGPVESIYGAMIHQLDKLLQAKNSDTLAD
jgi:dTMP kinase